MKTLFYYQTSIGTVGILENNNAITHLFFEGEPAPADAIVQETALLKEAGRQLQLYLAGQLQTFTLPLAPDGTEYMRHVWVTRSAMFSTLRMVSVTAGGVSMIASLIPAFSSWRRCSAR